MRTKVCSKCGVEKDLCDFYENKKLIDGHVNTCKKCVSKRSMEWQRANIESVKLTSKLWEENNKYARKKIRSKWYESNKEKEKIRVNEWNKRNRKRVNDRNKKWHLENPEKVRESRRKSYLKKKKITHTLKDISSFFINSMWPYSTEGKDEVAQSIKEIMGDINPIQKNSFLSMPNLGRELNLLQDVIRLEDSVGIERDDKLFRSIQRAFAKFFPTMKVEKDCIDSYSINTSKVFDVAHLDYNGFLTESHIKAASKLVNDGTMTFVTLNMHPRFEKMEMFRPIDELTSIGNVVFEKEYYGKRKCPMITMGIAL